MTNRTFKIKTACIQCSKSLYCQTYGISRDDIYQSLKDAKLYIYRSCGMREVVEEEK